MEKKASGWSFGDKLTVKCVKDGTHGTVLYFDPTVLQVDKEKFLKNPDAKVQKSKGGQYQTVGAHEGVWAFSQPVELPAGSRYYVIEADVKSDALSTDLFYPQVFIRGYQKYSQSRHGESSSYMQIPHKGGPAYSEMFGKKQRAVHEGDFLMVYRASLVCRITAKDKWQHFEMGVKIPKTPRYVPDVILLKPYAMWPLGYYYFDNIVFRTSTKEEYMQLRKKGHISTSTRKRQRRK